MGHIVFKIIIGAGFLLLSSGCTTKTHINFKSQYPHIATLEPVPNIDFNISNGCVCGDSLANLVNGTKSLRNAETYYRTQIELYNKEFSDE